MRKILLPLLSLGLLISLASCNAGTSVNFIEGTKNNGLSNTFDTQTQTGVNNQGTATMGGTYTNPSISVLPVTDASPKTDVETTVEKVYDSVVSINVYSTQFTGAGSGVLFASDENLGLSYIATCFHVIEDCYSYVVTLTNGEEYKASLVGGNAKIDLAILSIEATGLTYASLYDNSDNLKLGSSVVCIGNPLGTLPGSVSAGVISYVNRHITTSNYYEMTLIQTDVAINSGNSGGGLFNTAGSLIGIVNAKYADEDIEGLGFAIPVNTLLSFINSVFTTASYNTTTKDWKEGYISGDWAFGFTISDGYYVEGFGHRTACVYVSQVINDKTASLTSLNVEDIINSVSIDYQDSALTDIAITTFTSASDIMEFLYSANLAIGDTVTFNVTRGTTKVNVSGSIVQYIYQLN